MPESLETWVITSVPADLETLKVKNIRRRTNLTCTCDV